MTKSIESELGVELMELHRSSYGRGAARVAVHVLADEVVVFLDGLQLMPNEEFLVDAGHADQVVDVRARFHQAIEEPFRFAVERATGRIVTSFSSVTHLDPNYVVEIFRLRREPVPALPEPN